MVTGGGGDTDRLALPSHSALCSPHQTVTGFASVPLQFKSVSAKYRKCRFKITISIDCSIALSSAATRLWLLTEHL